MCSNYVQKHRDWKNTDKGTGKKIDHDEFGFAPRGGVPMPVPTQFQCDMPGAGKPKSRKVTE